MKGKQRSQPNYTPKKYQEIVERENNQIKQSQKVTNDHFNNQSLIVNQKEQLNLSTSTTTDSNDIDLKMEKRKLLEEKRKLRETYGDDKNLLEQKTKEIDENLQKLKLIEKNQSSSSSSIILPSSVKLENEKEIEVGEEEIKLNEKEEKRKRLEEKRKLREQSKLNKDNDEREEEEEVKEISKKEE